MSKKNKTKQLDSNFIIGLVTIVMVAIVGVGIYVANTKGTQNTEAEQGSEQLSSEAGNFQTVAATTFASEIASKEAVILDIRTPEEYESGRIEGAVNIDYYASDFEENLEKLDRDAAYKVYCNSGNRSASALNLMEEMGFTNVVELDGGIQAWNLAQQPVCTNC